LRCMPALKGMGAACNFTRMPNDKLCPSHTLLSEWYRSSKLQVATFVCFTFSTGLKLESVRPLSLVELVGRLDLNDVDPVGLELWNVDLVDELVLLWVDPAVDDPGRREPVLLVRRQMNVVARVVVVTDKVVVVVTRRRLRLDIRNTMIIFLAMYGLHFNRRILFIFRK
jgi:hypothetical protein